MTNMMNGNMPAEENGLFELNGVTYELVTPTTLSELARAVSLQQLLQYTMEQGGEEMPELDYLESLHNEQERRIQQYIGGLGEVDYRVMVNNISTLASENGMRLEDLETALSISQGYLAKTAQIGSQKKLSIDIVWKIARLFGVEIKAIMSAGGAETAESVSSLLVRFIDKLQADAENGKIEWSSYGGISAAINPKLVGFKIVYMSEGVYVYKPDRAHKDATTAIAKDVFYCENFMDGRELVIVPYNTGFDPRCHYDFLLVSGAGDTAAGWELMFSTEDETDGVLDDRVDTLYDAINLQENGFKIDPAMKRLIQNYLH